MRTYRVFNERNAVVNVTEVDLENAVFLTGFLPTHISNAASIAMRKDLLPRLRATLISGLKREQIAAAKAILALSDIHSVSVLEYLIPRQQNLVVSNIYRAVAIQLKGSDFALAYFNSSHGEPKIKSILIANYDGYRELEDVDIPFLVRALESYINKDQSWILKVENDIWAARVDIIIYRLVSEKGLSLLSKPEFHSERLLLIDLLGRLPAGLVEKSTTENSARLAKELSKMIGHSFL